MRAERGPKLDEQFVNVSHGDAELLSDAKGSELGIGKVAINVIKEPA